MKERHESLDYCYHYWRYIQDIKTANVGIILRKEGQEGMRENLFLHCGSNRPYTPPHTPHPKKTLNDPNASPPLPRILVL